MVVEFMKKSIPEHKRFTYSSEGLSCLNVGVIEKSQIYHEIERRLSKKEILKFSTTKSVEEIFERTFRYATKFEEWLDDEWRIN